MGPRIQDPDVERIPLHLFSETRYLALVMTKLLLQRDSILRGAD